MEIRTKHLTAGFEAGIEAGIEAGLESLKAMENGAKQYDDKEGALFFGPKCKKKQARKNGPPQFKSQSAVAGQISFNLK